jgi:hypothetical protein
MEEEPREQEIRLNPEMIVVRAGGAVESVNGQTGDVVLTTSDLENTSGYQTGSEVESAISSAITAEQEAREQADATITASVTAVANDLAAEVTNRQNADTTIQTSVDALMQGLTTETSNRAAADTQLQSNITAVQNSVTAEATARANADTALQGQIDAITASSDVKDIVGTHAALENYDTSTLGNNDIIKVLQDETQGGATTYYRWNATTQTFSLIGEEGPYYTKSQTDTLLNAKQDTLTAGTNITISGSTISATDTTYSAGNGLDLTGTVFSADTTVLATQSDLSGKQDTLTAGNNIQINGNTISATDTTYSAFVGTDGTSAGTAGLVPAPATTDADKFLKSDGTWDTAGGGSSVTVVQTAGTSTTDVMSQNATTNMVFGDPAHQQLVRIGAGATAGNWQTSQDGRIAIGAGSTATGFSNNIAIGNYAKATSVQQPSISIGNSSVTKNNTIVIGGTARNKDGERNTMIGFNSTVDGGSRANCVALGYSATCSRSGEVNIGAGTSGYGYNSTNYRVLGGVHDPVDAHDAATKGYVDGLVGNVESILQTLNSGSGV